MDKETAAKLLKQLSESVAAGELDQQSLQDLADGFETIDAQAAEFDQATQLRYLALQPLIAEKVGFPESGSMNVVMKNWGRQHLDKSTSDEPQPGDVSVVMKNWGRQHLAASEAIENTPKEVSVVMKNWGRQHL